MVAAAIDAQFTIALSEENGYRTSDLHRRELLPPECRTWAASYNSLMAVPIRGRMRADHLSPTVGTILETHSRASLLFGLRHVGDEIHEAIRHYKRKRSDTKEQTGVRVEHTKKLWHHWSGCFGISRDRTVEHDGALNFLVCATAAYLFHHGTKRPHRLRHKAANKAGGGPFYVLTPDVAPEMHKVI